MKTMKVKNVSFIDLFPLWSALLQAKQTTKQRIVQKCDKLYNQLLLDILSKYEDENDRQLIREAFYQYDDYEEFITYIETANLNSKCIIKECILYAYFDMFLEDTHLNNLFNINLYHLINITKSNPNKVFLSELSFVYHCDKRILRHFSTNLTLPLFTTRLNTWLCLKSILKYVDLWTYNRPFQTKMLQMLYFRKLCNFFPKKIKKMYEKELSFCPHFEHCSPFVPKFSVICHYFYLQYRLYDIKEHAIINDNLALFFEKNLHENSITLFNPYFYVYDILKNEYFIFRKKNKKYRCFCWECKNIYNLKTYVQKKLEELNLNEVFLFPIIKKYYDFVHHGGNCKKYIKKGILAYLTYKAIFPSHKYCTQKLLIHYSPSKICETFQISLNDLLAGEQSAMLCLRASPSMICVGLLKKANFPHHFIYTVQRIMYCVEPFYYNYCESHILIYNYVHFIINENFIPHHTIGNPLLYLSILRQRCGSPKIDKNMYIFKTFISYIVGLNKKQK